MGGGQPLRTFACIAEAVVGVSSTSQLSSTILLNLRETRPSLLAWRCESAQQG